MSTGTGETDLPGSPRPSSGGMRERALRGVLWTVLQKWSVKLSTLVAFLVLSHLLGPHEFGLVALAMTFISFLSAITDNGFTNYLVQLQRLTSVITSTAFWISTGLGIALSAALSGLSGPISSAMHTPALQPLLVVLSVSLLLGGLSSVPAALLQRDLRFRELAMRQMSATALSVVAAVVLAFAGAGAWALVGQTVVRSVVATAVLWRTAGFRPERAFSGVEAKAMTSYAVKSLGAQLGTQLRLRGEVFFIGTIAGTTALGFWTVAGRLVGVVTDLASSVIATVAQPVLARLQGDTKRLSRALGVAQSSSALLLVPLMLFLALTSREVVPWAFGAKWAPAAGLASVLALRYLVNSMSNYNRTALMATGHPGAELVVTSIMLVVQLGLVLAFADDGLMTLAVVLTSWALLAVPIRGFAVRRLLRVPARTYRPTLAVVLAGGVAAGAAWGVQQWLQLGPVAHVAMVAGLGGAVYLGMVLLVARPVLMNAVDTVRSALGRRRAGSPAAAQPTA